MLWFNLSNMFLFPESIVFCVYSYIHVVQGCVVLLVALCMFMYLSLFALLVAKVWQLESKFELMYLKVF